MNDPGYRNFAAEILRRQDRGEPEANITSAVRDFLIVTGLPRSEEVVEENPPSGASRRAGRPGGSPIWAEVSVWLRWFVWANRPGSVRVHYRASLVVPEA